MKYEVTLQFPLTANDENEAVGFCYNHIVEADTTIQAFLHVLGLKGLEVGPGVFVVPQNASMYYVNPAENTESKSAEKAERGNGAGKKGDDHKKVSGTGHDRMAGVGLSGGPAQEVGEVDQPIDPEGTGPGNNKNSEGTG